MQIICTVKLSSGKTSLEEENANNVTRTLNQLAGNGRVFNAICLYLIFKVRTFLSSNILLKNEDMLSI